MVWAKYSSFKYLDPLGLAIVSGYSHPGVDRI